MCKNGDFKFRLPFPPNFRKRVVIEVVGRITDEKDDGISKIVFNYGVWVVEKCFVK